MGEYERYTLGRRNLSCKNHWEELASSIFRITKPTVICFGGNASTDAKEANAMCRMAQGLIGLKYPTTENEFATANDVDFIGVGYGKDRERGTKKGSLTDYEKTQFVNSIFLPLCIDEKGYILPKESIVRNFNQITFFSHCYGAREISTIVGKTYKTMLKVGVEESVIEEALDQMFSVSYAPYQKSGCPSLQVIPMKDTILLNGPEDSKIVRKFLKDEYYGDSGKNGGTVAFKEDNYTVSVLVSNMLNNHLNEHGISCVSRNEDWQFIESDCVGYGDEVSQVMGYALASSVANSIQNQNSENFTPKPSIDEVLEEAQSILGETQNSKFADFIEEMKLKLEPSLMVEDKDAILNPFGVLQDNNMNQAILEDIYHEQ